jgi:hypothetical protein
LELLREAKRLGIEETFLQFVKNEGPFRREKSRSSGCFGEKFFRPSPAMRAFREVAKVQMHENKISRLFALPGFGDWFQDWTMPTALFGRRVRLGTACGDAPEPLVAVLTSPAIESTANRTDTLTDTSSGATATTNQKSKYPDHLKKDYTTGRKGNPNREPVLEYCYDEYFVKEIDWTSVFQQAKGLFQQRYRPQTREDVREFAIEWANRFIPPLPTNRQAAGEKFGARVNAGVNSNQ